MQPRGAGGGNKRIKKQIRTKQKKETDSRGWKNKPASPQKGVGGEETNQTKTHTRKSEKNKKKKKKLDK